MGKYSWLFSSVVNLTIPEGRDSDLLPPQAFKTGKNQAKRNPPDCGRVGVENPAALPTRRRRTTTTQDDEREALSHQA